MFFTIVLRKFIYYIDICLKKLEKILYRNKYNIICMSNGRLVLK